MRRRFRRIEVRARPGRRSQGWLTAGALRFPVALGRSGIRADKREGDGATPRGIFRPLRLWWRADRRPRPRTGLRVRPIVPADGWCEDPQDRRYNRPIQLSDTANGDRLWRNDPLYDLIIELDHTTNPRVAGRGSAVFIHIARAGFGPTAGCIALRSRELRQLLEGVGTKTRIRIQ